MIRIVLATHGAQSQGMLDTVQMLTGPQVDIAAYSLLPEQTMESFSDTLRKEVVAYGVENVLFMTDLMNGSPCNAVSLIAREYNVYHITGMNLAALIAAVLYRNMPDMTVGELSEKIMSEAQGSMVDVHALLNAPIDDDDEDEE